MRTIPAAMKEIIDSGDFTGRRKAVTRVTINPRPFPGTFPVGSRKYFSLLYRNLRTHGWELPNVKSVKWSRDVDNSIGSCSLELFNTKPLPPGTMPDVGDTFDLLGYYTYNRGRSSYAQTNWGHAKNEWRDTLKPDSMIKVYQGYGEPNYDVLPEDDPAVVLTGVWLVDDVSYTADGLISVECRDAGRLLADQIAFPPVVPLPEYPLSFVSYHQVENPDIVEVNSDWVKPKYKTSSNAPYVGHGPVHGHHPRDGFDDRDDTYWLSVGNPRPDRGYSFEWLEGEVSLGVMSAMHVKVWGGPYLAYVSVKSNGVWQGAAVIPYDPTHPISAPNGANIPYVASSRVDRNGSWRLAFSRNYENVTAVRFTFTDLYHSGLGPPFYRAGVRTMEVNGGTPTVRDGGFRTEGNYGDYSEIVKLLLAYGGFYWPQHGRQFGSEHRVGEYGATVRRRNTKSYSFGEDDSYLIKGRIWGDIEMAGVAGKPGTELGVEIWDKKPLLDGIAYIKDILGFIFFVDEQGAAQWRSPNTFRLGNWRSQVDGLGLVRTLDYITIRDDQAILGLRAVLSSRNLRDHVFVANVNGKTGATSAGRGPTNHFRRVGGWTDQNFSTVEECQVMADLVTLRQLFTYRRNTLRIPGNPEIQIDDQVRILERTTGDSYFHYVSAISSTWELENGRWEYDLTTSWLGENPAGEWAFQTEGLAQETLNYLAALGQI